MLQQNYLGYPVDIAIQPLDIRGLVDVSINDDTTKITRQIMMILYGDEDEDEE